MITAVMKAIQERAPEKAKRMKGKQLERYATEVVKRHSERLADQMPDDSDPAGQVMMREILLHDAIEEATAPDDLTD
ncbi:MAG: hypothetical protein ACOCYW_03540 [Roseicyclus sp.]